MSKTLVIVESPAKAKTIGRFLGSGYDVQASFGHIRDLPENAKDIPAEFKGKKWSHLGVNVEKDFEPVYIVTADKKRHVDSLKSSAKGADRLLLATDEDREGESISWHILEVLKPKKGTQVERIVFHEITPEAISAALAKPRQVDQDLVRAQEARRILDRLYGYTLSPLLWKKVGPNLSAGRVQSVATRLVVLRERERRDFVTSTYSGVQADLASQEGSINAKLHRVGSQEVADGADFGADGKLQNKNRLWLRADEAEAAAKRLAAAKPWTVSSVETNPGVENPPEPFMTSTLQQEASRQLGFTPRRTMQIAQNLYEGVDVGGGSTGLITYMRTDSLTLADRALKEAREEIKARYGAEYLPDKPKQYRSKAKNAQEAHEAIRPTDLSRDPQSIKRRLTDEQFKLYELIWKRTIACQMLPARVERTRAEIEITESDTFTFRSSGKRIVFPGFLRAYVEGSDDPDADLGDKEKILPPLKVGQVLEAVKVSATHSETRPPARYTEASLVKKLEEEGVGRPSTYASILGTIQDRGYVFKRKQELVPTFTAFAVTEILENNFEDLVDTKFTARMEDELDDIAEGKRNWVEHLRDFYSGSPDRPGLEKEVESKSAEIPFPLIALGEDLVVRIGRNGPFIQRGEGGTGNTASVPEDLAPSELTLDKAKELLASRQGPASAGTDPATGRQVFHKKGRFGDYLELEPAEGGEPKRVSVPPGADVSSLTDEDLGLLLSFPRTLGKHPASGADVVVAIGRYGAYLTAGEQKANVGEWRPAASMTLEAAVSALEAGGVGGRASAKPSAIKEFGKLEGAAGIVKLMSGRYGPYVTDGTTNATLPKTLNPDELTAEQALELLAAKAAAGPAKKPFKRRGAAKKTPATKARAKKPR